MSITNTILEVIIKEGILMPKAKQLVDQGMFTIQTAVGSLQQAANLAEKADNKSKIYKAISDLNCCKHNLSGYQY